MPTQNPTALAAVAATPAASRAYGLQETTPPAEADHDVYGQDWAQQHVASGNPLDVTTPAPGSLRPFPGSDSRDHTRLTSTHNRVPRTGTDQSLVMHAPGVGWMATDAAGDLVGLV